MSWLSNFVRPTIKALVGRPDQPDNLWRKCPRCEKMIFHRELEANLYVCPHCRHHMRLGAARRLEILFDEGECHRIELPKVAVDPLKFRDQKRYTERLREAHAKTGEQDALIVAHGTLVGRDITIEMTQEVLHDLLRASDRRVTIEEIQKRVAEHFNIRLSDMHSARRSRAVARPRQVAMYLAKQLTTRSLPEIGRKFGGRDHTTVIYGCEKIGEEINADSRLRQEVVTIRDKLYQSNNNGNAGRE